MKQANLAKFFSAKPSSAPAAAKAGGAGSSAKPAGTVAAAADNSPAGPPGKASTPAKSTGGVLVETNHADKKRPREGAGVAATVPAAKPPPSADGSRQLKRLRKGPTAAAEAVDATAPAELEDTELPNAAAAAAASSPQQQPLASAIAAAPTASSPAAQPPAADSTSQASQPSGSLEGNELAETDNSADSSPRQGKAGKGKRRGKAKAGKAKAAALAAEGADKEEVVAAAEEEEAEEEAGAKAPAGKAAGKAAAKKPLLQALKEKGAKVEGVGQGSLAAAARHGDFDLAALATWQPGQPVPFSFLAATFEAIAEESKRLAITHLLTNAFRAIILTSPADLLPTVYLCVNQVAPAHEGVELGIGDATLIKALATATGKKEASIKKEYDESGDLGVVAAAARATQRTMFQPAALTIAGVLKTFREIASTEGKNSQERKKQLIGKLLVSSRQGEAGYIMRALQGKLRIGLAEQTVLVALAHAAHLAAAGAKDADGHLADRLEQAAQAVKMCYSQRPAYDALVPALLAHGWKDLCEHVKFTPGVPVKPMLAKPTTGVSEVLDKFTDQEFTCEYKYDGERAQVHVLPGGKVLIYSRNSEDNTVKYPDLAALVPQQLQASVQSVVLDCEAVAFDRETNKILPFQVLSTRARKDVKVADIKVQVCLFAFDCLYLNGRALLQCPLTERRQALYSALHEAPGTLQFAQAKVSRDVEELARFLDDSVAAGTEGLIVKTMDSTYEPSRRSAHWLKLKKDYLAGVGDTFDVVVIGAWFGKGKRTGQFGSFLLAVYNEEGEEYQTISKIGTGFSEEQLKEFSEQLRTHAIDQPRSYYRYCEQLLPDVWFDAKVVWEVLAADLSISPRHQAAAGLVDSVKGISIRFPRLVRVREDKTPELTTSPEQIAEMYRKQVVAQNHQKPRAGADDDY